MMLLILTALLAKSCFSRLEQVMESTEIEPKPKKSWPSHVLQFIKHQYLVILMLVAIIASIAIGFTLLNYRDKPWTEREKMYIKFPGEIVFRGFQGLLVPLVASSMVTAVGSLDLKTSGKIGGRAFAYYLMTSALAVIVGLCTVSVIRPGERGSKGNQEDVEIFPVVPEDTVMDLVRNIFPDNLIQATMHRYKTLLVGTNHSVPFREWKIESSKHDGTNIMGIVAFSAILGLALSSMGSKGKALVDVFTCLYTAVRIMTNFLLLLSPIVIFSLVTGQILDGQDFVNIIGLLGWFFLTVMVSLAIHGFIVLPAIFAIVTRSSPVQFMVNMTQAVLTAFGTNSSAATIPVTMDCLEKKNKVHPVVTRFVLLGATINMDGTALYEATAAIFIAQILGVPYSFGNLLAVSITATLTSMGASGAGIVVMMIVLSSIGLPAKYMYYVLPIDFILSRFRTIINVLGDAIGAGVLNHICRNDLEPMKSTI